MKKIVFSYLFSLLVISGFAQKEYEHSLDGIQWVKIESRQNVTLKTHSGKGLLIKTSQVAEVPAKAKGLKLVGSGGQTANTEIGFYIMKQGNDLIVRNLNNNSGDSEIFLPSSQNISVVTKWHGDISIADFKGEIEATAELNGHINVKNAVGPVTANTLNGDVEINFTTVNQDSPISLFTTNGHMDVSLPSQTPAILQMGSLNGNIYTDFDLTVPEKDGLKAVTVKNVKGAINGGGVTIKLNTTNGNIYLRKGKN